MLLKEIGERVRGARLSRGMTQAEMAKRLNVSAHFVSNIELGKQTMSVTTLSAICDTLNVSADWILRNRTPEARKITDLEIVRRLEQYSPQERGAMLKLLDNLAQIVRSENE